MTSLSPVVLAPGGSRSRRRPGMSWTMLTARGPSAPSSRRVTADISGGAPSAAVAPPPGPDPIGLVSGAFDLDRGLGLGVMSIAVGEQLFLAPSASLRHDVLERLHLLGDETTPLLDHPHSRHGGLDGQRPEDPSEERNDERGAEPEEKRRGMDLHRGPPDPV